jgi:hypothetical protein
MRNTEGTANVHVSEQFRDVYEFAKNCHETPRNSHVSWGTSHSYNTVLQSSEPWARTGSDRLDSTRHGSARLGSGERRRTASEPIGIRNQLPQKDTQTLRLEAGIGLPRASDLRNVLLCPVFRTVPGWADAVRGLPFVCIEFYLCGLCRSDPVRSQLNYLHQRSNYSGSSHVLCAACVHFL